MAQPFSKRTMWDLDEASLSIAVRAARASGRELFDLTVSNPTMCGFEYDPAAVLGSMSDSGALTYDPDAKGMLSARTAVAEYYDERQAQVDPGHIILTTSTSEAYSFLFRLLCDAGDEVLVGQPSYPLFDYLATLDDVHLRHYPMFYDFGWWIDFAELERRIGPRTRAVLVVHPNNPTGHATSLMERHQLQAMCRKHGLALIVDEVFLDYGLRASIPSFATGDHACLTFVLSGISKIAGLPQMKVGWVAALGPESGRAVERLEVIADTFLSLNAPVQIALPGWLRDSEVIRRQILARIRENVDVLSRTSPLTCLPVEAGWSAVLQVPQSLGGAGLAEILAAEAGVIVHPGSFYQLPGGHRLVISLIVQAASFAGGLSVLAGWCKARVGGD